MSNDIDIQLFREKSQTYMVCYDDKCPKANQCLRRTVAAYVPEEQLNVRCVNPNYREIPDGQCPAFKPTEKVRMAVGMMHLLDDVPYETACHIKRNLISQLTRKRFYAYRKGALPIPPDVQQLIVDTFAANGHPEPPQFDGYTEDYLW